MKRCGRRNDPITPEVRNEVLARDGGCVYPRFRTDHVCFGPLELHHRKLRRHGDHRAVNLCAVCGEAHRDIHAHPHWAYAVGLLVHSWDDVPPLEAS